MEVSQLFDSGQQKYDYKSLGHAVRLLGQAEEFLQDGKITLPRPEADYLKTILRGTIDDSDISWFDLLNDKIFKIKKELQPNSTLPDEPKWEQINKLCTKMLKRHISD